MIVSLQISPKTQNICEKKKTWKLEYLLNHSINFSVWFTTTFYECFLSLRGYMMIVSLQMSPKTWKNCEKRKTWKCEYLLNHSINFSVWFTTTFYECFISLRGYMMIVSLQNVPENLEKLREKENLKMRISTKPFYKRFSVVHNYFLWMCLIIERIYDDRISPKCPQKLRIIARKKKTWKLRISNLNHSINFSVWFTTTFYECFLSLRGYMMIVSLQMSPKTWKNCEKRKTWKCEYLLNHSINFSVWFTTTFYECFISLRGYMMIVSLQNVPENLEKLREKEYLEMRISTKPFYKRFSVVHNYFLWMCLIIERIYDDRIAPNIPKNLEYLRKKENLKTRISTKPFYKLFSVVHNYFLWMFLIIERIYDDRISPKCPRKLRKIVKKGKPETANIY